MSKIVQDLSLAASESPSRKWCIAGTWDLSWHLCLCAQLIFAKSEKILNKVCITCQTLCASGLKGQLAPRRTWRLEPALTLPPPHLLQVELTVKNLQCMLLTCHVIRIKEIETFWSMFFLCLIFFEFDINEIFQEAN